MTDIFALLRLDHERIFQLLEQTRACRDLKHRGRWFLQLEDEIEAHAIAEESAIYPRLGEITSRRLTRFAEVEHEEIHECLERLEDSDIENDQDWIDNLRDLEEALVSHITKEEHEVFSKLEKKLRPGQLEQMKLDFLAIKNQRHAFEAA